MKTMEMITLKTALENLGLFGKVDMKGASENMMVASPIGGPSVIAADGSDKGRLFSTISGRPVLYSWAQAMPDRFGKLYSTRNGVHVVVDMRGNAAYLMIMHSVG